MRGLVPATNPLKSLHERDCLQLKTLHFEEQVVGTGPKNSNWLEFVGIVAGTKDGHCD